MGLLKLGVAGLARTKAVGLTGGCGCQALGIVAVAEAKRARRAVVLEPELLLPAATGMCREQCAFIAFRIAWRAGGAFASRALVSNLCDSHRYVWSG